MTTITNITLTVEYMIKNPIGRSHTFFGVVTFSKINSLISILPDYKIYNIQSPKR